MCETESTGLSKSREQDVRAELTRLLESPAFGTSKRCREFLEYIIEHAIKGPAGAVKERSIGVELFQLSQDFDTGQHTIVRVTANEEKSALRFAVTPNTQCGDKNHTSRGKSSSSAL